jgi:sterol desaturase/sphingolipid hydroxylase (fatty acid hydroxylase superfamily)
VRLDEWFGICVAALYPAIIVLEHLRPARRFPKVRFWNVKLGIVLFVYIAAVNVAVLRWLPLEWLAAHKLIDLSQAGMLPSIAIGYLSTTLVMYGWHRAEHRFDFLWRAFHQIHHSPRHLNVYVAGVNHPLDLAITMSFAFPVGLFVLGIDPVAALIVSHLGGVAAFVQHANISTPRWLAIVLQRPEAHCVHHQRGLHAYNYSDLPLWDFVFGTFRNPSKWAGETGFDEPADRRYWAMLACVDVNAPLIGEHTLGQRPLARSAEECA